MLVYYQLSLISGLFEGEMIGPACLYIDAKPGQEDAARTCLESIDSPFLQKISCVLHADCAIIKQHKSIKADIYMISGLFNSTMDVSPHFVDFKFDLLIPVYPHAL